MTFTDAPAPMDDCRTVLRKVGLALIVVGLLDIGWMVYCLSRGWGYRSSFNVFALVAGILLARGSLPTARVVAFFSAFLLTGSAGIALLFPIVMRVPLDLVWLYVRLHPLMAIGFLLLVPALLVLLAWTCRTPTKPVVLTAMDQQRIDYRHWCYRPSGGFVAGALLSVILAAFVGGSLRSGTVAQAKAEARARVGPGYQLFVSSLYPRFGLGGPTGISATVVAYSEHEVRAVPVEVEP
jgi:hypothetical protein